MRLRCVGITIKKSTFSYFYAALTVFVVHIESLKATSLIHAGKFSKLLNTTTSTTTEDTPTTDLQTEGVEEPEEEEEVSNFSLNTLKLLKNKVGLISLQS